MQTQLRIAIFLFFSLVGLARADNFLDWPTASQTEASFYLSLIADTSLPPPLFSQVQNPAAITTNLNLPKLALTTSKTNFIITWPASFWNYVLQYRPANATPSAWANATNHVTVSNALRQVLITPATQGGYFRLAQLSGPYTNSLGMPMTQIPAGTFTMGYWQTTQLPAAIINISNWVHYMGDYDEMPAHQVTISQPFWLGTYEISNKEYEQYDATHAKLRGKLGFSTNDNEAVVFVSWNDAMAFCNWLSVRDGLPYRLPTEAEWEYACRAGTTTHFSTGDSLPIQYPNNPGNNPWYPILGSPVSLYRGLTPANPWGLYDMHGNVEEWCSDWYGPYDPAAQTDPVGRADGLARVSRGGSHSTFQYYLRSENRSGALPEDNSWYIGFRVVLGTAPATLPLPAPPPPTFQTNVIQNVPPGLANVPNTNTPYFFGPLRYVNYPSSQYGPVYSSHNHDPGGIVECANGDLLAVWFSGVDEYGRELSLAASRLRYGATNWDNVSSFYDIPDRNDPAPCLGSDGNQTLYFFSGVSAAATWGPLAVIARTSTNNGADWTKPHVIIPEHSVGHQPITGFLHLANGDQVIHCDATPNSSGGTLLWISHDNGITWTNPAAGRPTPVFSQGNTGAWIAGVHAALAQLSDGRFIAFGRGDNINNQMPRSLSSDGGSNWTYSASGLPPIGSPQRATILRLQEGPLFLASFASGLTITNATGGTRTGSGLYAALSFDNGITWPYIRLVTDDGPGRTVETMDGVAFTLSASNAEPYGYLSSTQGRNGLIHLISSRDHYKFNLKWLATRPP